jgi:RHS repeat-associated protein
MKLSLKQFAQFGLVAAVCVGFAAAQQVSTGRSQFGSFGGGPFDVVNLGNLNVHFTIPVLHKAGRGMPFNFDLTYDSSVWKTTTSNGVTQWTPVPNFGWQTSAPFGNVTYSVSSSGCYYTPPSPYIGPPILAYTVYQYQNWTFVDRSGTTHPFTLNSPGYTSYWNGATVANTSCSSVPTTYPSGSGSTTDGSGYTISITNVSTATVTSRSGIQAAQTTVTDANGNRITSNGSQYFDTLSASIPVMTVSGTAPSPTTFTYAAPSGASASYTMSYVKYTVATHFGVTVASSLIAEYGPTAKYLVDNVTLPDQTVYRFTYEAGPIGCVLQSGTSACVTGRIASVTLPTGGSITYTYSGGTNNTGIYSDGSTSGLTRMLSPTTSCTGTIPTGCWQYARSKLSGTPGPGSTWSTTVTDPVGNQSFLNFVEDSTTTTSTTTATYNMYETQRQVYQGLISTSNCSTSNPTNCLLSTIITCYKPYVSSCATTAVSSPITYKQITKYLPDSSGSSEMVGVNYNNSGLPTTIYAGSATQTLRVTNISYASLGNNIVDHPGFISLVDGSSNLLSQTTYSYDDSGYPVQPSSGTPQHTSITGSRGNLTTVTQYKSASASLSAHFQYYDTGAVYKSWNLIGSATTYTYDPTLQSSGNYTKSCGNSFPTGVTPPIAGLSTSTAWNCTGGVATQLTDANGNASNVTYSDPYFWRPASSKDPTQNTTTYAYTVAAGGSGASAESKMIFNGNNSIAEQLATLDGFGRVQYSQQEQAVGSSNYDSVQAIYDSLGQLYQTTMPYVASAGQGNANAAKTTRSYDALGRITQLQDGGGYINYIYNQNDVLQQNGPAPAGESLKQKQMEYDALERLTSVCEVTAGTTSWPGGNCSQTHSLTGYRTTYVYDFDKNTGKTRTTVTQGAQGSSPQTRVVEYDLMGRIASETNPESGTTSYVYDTATATCGSGTAAGSLVETINNAGVHTCYGIDALGRINHMFSAGASGGCRNFIYGELSNNGLPIQNGKGRIVEAVVDFNCNGGHDVDEYFSYDPDGRITDVWQSTPNSGGYYHTTASYWANGVPQSLALNLYSTGTALIPKQTYGIDGEGRVISVSAASGQNPVTSTTYNAGATNAPIGALTSVIFGSSDSDTFSYDSETGRLIQYAFTVGSTPKILSGALRWNANGSLASLATNDTLTSAGPQVCSFSHDDLSRVSTDACGTANTIMNSGFESGDTGWIHNSPYSMVNNPANAQSGSWYLSGSSTTQAGANATTNGTTSLMSVGPGSLIQYGGWVNRVSGTGYTWWSGEFRDSGGNHISWIPAVGISDRSTPSGWNYYEGSVTAPSNAAYVLFYAEIHGGGDPDTSLTTAYFDGAVFSASASLWNQMFSYDPFGNITKTATAGISFQPLYSTATNQFTSLPGVTPTYDATGNLTYDGVHHYGWDGFGKMATIDSASVTYDAFGRMVENNASGTYTQIVYSPLGNKLAVMSGQTLQKAFVPLPGGATAVYKATGLAYYRHADHLGSSRLATTPGRTVYSSTAFAAFGEPYKQTGTTDLSFTGQDQDTVSGMHDFLARRYNPTSGRWLSPDPAGLGAVDPSNPQTWNRYAYVMNNPLSLIDPFGEDCYSWENDCGASGGGGGCDWLDPSCQWAPFGPGGGSGGAGGRGGGEMNPAPGDWQGSAEEWYLACMGPNLYITSCYGGPGQSGGQTGSGGGGLPIGQVLVRLTNPSCAKALYGSTKTAFGTLQKTTFTDVNSFQPAPGSYGDQALKQAVAGFAKFPSAIAFTHSIGYGSGPAIPIQSFTFIQPSFYSQDPLTQVANLMHELQHGAQIDPKKLDPADGNYQGVYDNILQQCPMPTVNTTTSSVP